MTNPQWGLLAPTFWIAVRFYVLVNFRRESNTPEMARRNTRLLKIGDVTS